MIRAAIYARFSSDLQNDKSIGDQIAYCSEICSREKMKVVATFEDRAISGSSAANRPGFRSMMNAASQKKFDVIVAEDMDRIFRDQSDYHAARKQLDFLGVTFHTASGKVTKIDGALRALMGEMFIENLALHMRRGHAGIIKEGRSAGGRAYGYRPILGKPGELQIIEEEATVIRRIFGNYVAGTGPREIALSLNAEGVQPPRGKFWRASTLIGNTQRGYGILQNELYTGRIVWNRVRMIKDPETGRRISRVNPASEWQRADAPHLRIISDEIFAAAQAHKAKRSVAGVRKQRKPRHLLSGLLRCGACDSGMQVKDKDHGRIRIVCSQHREAGKCSNRGTYYLDKIEETTIQILRKHLGNRSSIAYFIKCYNAERQAASADAINRKSRIAAKLAEAQRSLDRIIDAVARGTITDAEADQRIPGLRAARDEAAAELAMTEEPPKVVALHPKAVSEYLKLIDTLADFVGEDLQAGHEGLARSIRDVIETITVVPTPAGQPPMIRLKGHLESLLGEPSFFDRSLSGGVVVAREGLEPPTPGL